MKPKLSLVFCLLLLSGICLSQENDYKRDHIIPKKNVFYGTIGIHLEESYATLLGNYERMIYQFPDSFFNTLWIRAGAGPYVWWTGNGYNFVSTLSVLMGKKSSHLELGAGTLFTYNTDEKKFEPLVRDRHLAGNFGYRFQKPGGIILIRAGIGWPEYLYLSLGFCF